MMVIGAFLACCTVSCLKHRKALKRRAYEDSYRAPSEGGDCFTDIELGPSADRKESLLLPVCDLVQGIKASFSPCKPALRTIKNED